MSDSNVNRKYKDRLFNFIFGKEENREWTLQLYNAVNNSNYTDESLIEFNTLKDVLYLGMINDTSFLISDILSVYEHQSSFNPNMPLRMLEYVCELYTGYVKSNKNNKYGSKLIRLPLPKLVVFYNGKKRTKDEVILKLSDSFPKDTDKEADIEVKVRMININHGRSEAIMRACKPLDEYSWFIKEIELNLLKQTSRDLHKAVEEAINSLPSSFLIRDFILANATEVDGMLDREYNEAEVKELFKQEMLSDINDLYSWLYANGRDADVKKATLDSAFQQSLFEEYENYLNPEIE